MWQELGGLTDPAVLEDKVADYNVKVNQLWEDLMCFEMQLVDQLEVWMTCLIWLSNILYERLEACADGML